ncbi:protein kinase [Streptomyces caeni]|uniref:non-specific serine/threonine protein kinase n=1 Tax=Streptomyces caeni TaxID=2307231 RepID=A0ABW4IJU1_9ACTN
MNEWSVPGYTGTRELGSGASGHVVLAVHDETGVPVAVKYLSRSLLNRPGFVRDFRAEARLLGGLRSEHVAGLYEYVESPDGAAIVMELVDGVALRELLRRQGPVGPEEALTLLKGSLLGLADAHRLGVVHRDYKPANVIVSVDGVSKLIDFGITVSDGTTAGAAGTPAYMAPEQWRGAAASPAADVYAATATFFECLTGHRPYEGENLAELALQHLDATVPVEDVPEPVRPLVARGLAKTPEQRPENAREFVVELERIAGAAYGPGWEERGRGRLAALVAALLPLLLSAPPGTTQGTTDLATTNVGGHGSGWARSLLPNRLGLLASGAAVALALALAYGQGEGADPQQAAQAVATTSAQPGVSSGPTVPAGTASPTHGPSASPGSASPSPSASDDAPTVSPSASSGVPATREPSTPTVTATATTSQTPTAPVTSAPPAAAVKDVTIGSFVQTGSDTGAVTITVSTDGPGPVSVTLAWYSGNVYGQPGDPDGAAQTFLRSGATRYTLTVNHTFQGTGCYWGVRATTSPASAGGGAWQQLLTWRCTLR